MNYRKRIIDEALAFKLCAKGAVVIEGPKWCGKTTTAKQQAKSILKMDAPQSRRRNIELSLLDPNLLLNGETPRLIDEWQLAPALWDSIRYEVDERGKMGQFILTGSTSANVTDEITHSGTGRFSWLKMRTMSLYESGESSGEVSLKSLFDGNGVVRGTNALGFEDIAFLTCRGGWPQALDLKEEIALSQAYDYLDAVVKSDISQVDGIAKNEERAKKYYVLTPETLERKRRSPPLKATLRPAK